MGRFHDLMQCTPLEILTTGFSFVWTKLFFRSATLIRRPFYLRGDKKRLQLGKGFMSGRGCRIEIFGNGKICFGTGAHIGDYVHIAASEEVKIGMNCLFASKIFISDTSHGSYEGSDCPPTLPPDERPLVSSKVEIGDNVWLGDNVVVLPGVSIGNGCVVGANSTVTKDIPRNTIVAGSPAKLIKEYDFAEKRWKKI